MRIVSLVPSLTELLFALDLGDAVVGRTGFCIHPRERVRRVPKVGGTKTVDIERIRALAPTHIVVNVDENEKPTVDAIAAFVPNVVVTHPLTVDDNLGLYRQFGDAFDRRAEAERLQSALAAALDGARARVTSAGWATRPVSYLIWKDPWMTVAPDTYIASMLALVGLEARAPATGRRYPEVNWAEFPANACDFILFSSEPYRFRDHHLQAFAVDHGLAPDRCRLIDAEMASWYGPRAIEAVAYMLRFRESLDRE
jgi:ABC-type Fe3+-hydroxamate transport system substrate-binding protein